MNILKALLFTIVAGGLLAPVTARAAAFQVNLQPCGTTLNAGTSLSNTSDCSATWGLNSLDAHLTTELTFSSLKTGIDATFTAPAGSTFLENSNPTAYQNAILVDSMTPKSSAARGSMRVNLELDGALQAQPGITEIYGMSFGYYVPTSGGFVPATLVGQIYDSSTSIDRTTYIDVPFENGVPIQIQWQLTSYATLDSDLPGPASRSAKIDFMHTAFISSIDVFDQSGNRVSGATVQSSEGKYFPVTGATAVPEPSSLLVFLSLIPALGYAAARRRKLGS